MYERDQSEATRRHDRRHFLTALGFAAAGGLAGCVEVSDGDVGELVADGTDADASTVTEASEAVDGGTDGDRGAGTESAAGSDDRTTDGDEWTVDKAEFDGWTRAGYDRRNTGYKRNVSAPSGDVGIEWETPVGRGPEMPLVADGTAYVYSSWAGTVVALDAETGETQWTYEDETLAHGISKTPALSDEHVYVSGERSLVAVDRDTGERAWAFDTGSKTRIPVVADGTVYVGTSLPLLALSLDGTEQWRAEIGTRWAPTVLDDAVYCGGRVVDRDSGEVRGYYNGGADTEPVVVDGRVFTADAISLDAFEAGVDGDRVWQSPDMGAPVFSNLVLAHGHVYCYVRGTDTLHAFDVTTGEPVWQVDRAASGNLSATDDALFVSDDGVSALDPADGSERWRVETGGAYASTPVIADGVVYVGVPDIWEDGGSVFALA